MRIMYLVDRKTRQKTLIEKIPADYNYRTHKLKIQAHFDPKIKEERSRTVQFMAKDADINNIMKKYRKGEVLPFQKRAAYFGEFPSGETYRAALEVNTVAKSEFELLPVEIRNEFDNDVSKLLDFCQENPELARERGLLAPLTEEEVVVPPTTEGEEPVPGSDPAPAPATEPVAGEEEATEEPIAP